MSDDKAAGKLQAILYQYGEKIGLGTAAGMLVLYLLFGVALAGRNQSAQRVKEAADRIAAESKNSHSDKAAEEFPVANQIDKDGNVVKDKDGKPVRVTSALYDEEMLKPWREIESTLTPPASGDWAVCVKTTVSGQRAEKPLPEKEEAVLVIGTVSLEKVEPGLQGITLIWKVHDAAGSEKEEAAKIDEVVIERQAKGKVDKTWKVPASQVTHVDKEVDKRATYEYRVVPVTKNPKFLAKRKTDRGTPTDWQSATMMDEWIISFISPNATEKTVQVKIEKFDKVAGPVHITRIQREGDEIGKWKDIVIYKVDDGLGGTKDDPREEFTYKHKVSVSGATHTVEFNTGCKLLKIHEIKVEVTVLKCHKKPLSAEPCKPEPKTSQIAVVEILYSDADGRNISVKWRGGKEAKMKNDKELDPSEFAHLRGELCDEHGGKKEETEDDKKKRELDDKARTLHAEAEQARRTFETKSEEAKRLEKQGKKEEAAAAKKKSDEAKTGAIEKYEKLLKEYKETKYVKGIEKAATAALEKLKK